MPLLSAGVVSYSIPDLSIVSATIHHGNSGGPCVDADGQIVGLAMELSKAGEVLIVKEGETHLIDFAVGYGMLIPVSSLFALADENELRL